VAVALSDIIVSDPCDNRIVTSTELLHKLNLRYGETSFIYVRSGGLGHVPSDFTGAGVRATVSFILKNCANKILYPSENGGSNSL